MHVLNTINISVSCSNIQFFLCNNVPFLGLYRCAHCFIRDLRSMSHFSKKKKTPSCDLWAQVNNNTPNQLYNEKTTSALCDKDISTKIVSGDVSTLMVMMVVVMMMKLEALNRSLTSAQHSLFLDELLGRQRALLLLERFKRLKRLHQLLHGGHFNRSTDLDRVWSEIW